MYAARTIQSGHKDIIHDVSCDFYGRRMATCSLDHTVRIWDMDENDEWVCTANWKTHSGSVWKVTWAHPEYGQAIATCSPDHSVVVWEEQIGEISHNMEHSSRWMQKSALADHSAGVTDIKFAPMKLGLMLAVCYRDGIVYIYEARDVMNLSEWTPKEVIKTRLGSASCLSWNTVSYAPMFAVGSGDPSATTGGKIEIYAFSSNKSQQVASISQITDPIHDLSFAPNVGRSIHTLAVASKNLHIISLKKPNDLSLKTVSLSPSAQPFIEKLEITIEANLTQHDSKVWRVAWNITGTILASSGVDGHILLWQSNSLKNWNLIREIKGDGNPVFASIINK